MTENSPVIHVAQCVGKGVIPISAEVEEKRREECGPRGSGLPQSTGTAGRDGDTTTPPAGAGVGGAFNTTTNWFHCNTTHHTPLTTRGASGISVQPRRGAVEARGGAA